MINFRNLTERDGNWKGAFNFLPVIVLFYRFIEFVAEAMLAYVAKLTSMTPIAPNIYSRLRQRYHLPGFECVVL